MWKLAGLLRWKKKDSVEEGFGRGPHRVRSMHSTAELQGLLWDCCLLPQAYWIGGLRTSGWINIGASKGHLWQVRAKAIFGHKYLSQYLTGSEQTSHPCFWGNFITKDIISLAHTGLWLFDSESNPWVSNWHQQGSVTAAAWDPDMEHKGKTSCEQNQGPWGTTNW